MNVENKRISTIEVAIFIAVSTQPDRWFTNAELRNQLGETMSLRSIENHTARFAKLGLVQRVETFPEHRFRWTGGNATYLKRLTEAAAMFGAVKSAA